MKRKYMGLVSRLVFFILLLPLLAACGEDEYRANVSELRLVSISPSNVYAGDIATILGRNFSLVPEENLVYIGETPAEVIEAAKDEIKIIMPVVEPGKHNIRVRTASGDLTGLEVNYLKTPDHEYLVQTVVGRKGVPDYVDGMGTEASGSQIVDGMLYAVYRLLLKSPPSENTILGAARCGRADSTPRASTILSIRLKACCVR